jgi:hypothetical protein
VFATIKAGKRSLFRCAWDVWLPPREIKSFRISWHGIRDSPMNLLTNDFVNNCGRQFGPAEEFEADIVRVGAEGILCEWR